MSGQENACKLEVNMYLSLLMILKKKKKQLMFGEKLCVLSLH